MDPLIIVENDDNDDLSKKITFLKENKITSDESLHIKYIYFCTISVMIILFAIFAGIIIIFTYL